jgi:D-sedoheptulose 7-phosphate isomerase
MTLGHVGLDLQAALDDSFDRRRDAADALVHQAEMVARACQAMAERFRARGRLLVFGEGMAAVDARHIAVEFLHPVVVGTRALPAIALTNDPAAPIPGTDGAGADLFALSLRVLARPGDIAMGLSLDGRCAGVVSGLATARALGLLTVALTAEAPEAVVARAADHAIVLGRHDPLVVREALVTTYHVLWELVHVFLDRPDGASSC